MRDIQLSVEGGHIVAGNMKLVPIKKRATYADFQKAMEVYCTQVGKWFTEVAFAIKL